MMTRKYLIGPALAVAALVSVQPWSTAALTREQPAGVAIEPEAITALERMGGYLRSLKAFQIVARTTSEEVLEDGQKVQYAGDVNALVQMPNRLLMSTTSDRRDRQFVYDGKEFTMLARRANYFATIPAPATLGLLADVLDDKYDIRIPLEDLFRWGGAQSPTEGITSAMYVGPGTVGGVTCGHFAFRQEGLDWQVWIQQGDFPLPRRLVLTTTTDPARPQYTATIDWNLAPSYNSDAFTFVPPPGTRRAVLAEPK
jgi:hypothetical protein